MPSEVIWPKSDALTRRLREIQEAGRPGAKAITSCKKDIRQFVIDDHKDKIMRSVDRYGKPLAPLRGGRRLTTGEIRRRGGSGPPLAPRGLASRVVTAFMPEWTTEEGVNVLSFGWSGVPWMKYHIAKGPRKRARNGKIRLPRRDVAGITPKGWRKIIDRHKALAADLIRTGGGR